MKGDHYVRKNRSYGTHFNFNHRSRHFRAIKLPQIGKALGESIKEFKKGASEISDVVNEPVKTEAQPKSDAPATTEVKKDETKTV